MPMRRTFGRSATTMVCRDHSGRQMDLPLGHGRPPAVSVSMLGLYLPDHRRRIVGAFTRSPADRVRNFR